MGKQSATTITGLEGPFYPKPIQRLTRLCATCPSGTQPVTEQFLDLLAASMGPFFASACVDHAYVANDDTVWHRLVLKLGNGHEYSVLFPKPFDPSRKIALYVDASSTPGVPCAGEEIDTIAQYIFASTQTDLPLFAAMARS